MTALEKLIRAEYLLNAWLVDNTELFFEEEGEVDDARALLIEVIQEMKEGR